MKKFLPSLAVLLVFFTSILNVQAQEPVMEAMYPDSNATNVSLDVVLKLDFDRNIRYNSTSTSKYIKIVETANPSNEVFSSLIVDGSPFGNAIIDADTLIISPGSSAFSPETQYSVKIDPGAVENSVDGTPFSGIDDVNTRWRFTTVSRPGLFSTSPANSATGVTGLETLTLTFDEEITLGNNKNLKIYKSGGTLFQTINTTNDSQLISVSVSNYDISISHDNFTGSQEFYVDVEEGFATSISNGVGSAAIAGVTQWSFITDAGPAMHSLSPANPPSGVNGDETLVLTYAENVTLQSNKNITIFNGDGSVFQTISSDNTSLVTFNSGTNAISINHNRFSGGQTYYVNTDEGLVTANDNNIASNAMTGSSAWAFSAADAPFMSFVSPVNNAIDVSAHEPLVMAFDEPVSLLNNKNLIIHNGDGTSFQTINTTSNDGLFSFNVTNDTITISHDPFSGGSSYYITMEEGVFVSANTAIGSSELTGSSTWTFSTANAPVISSFSPDQETGVSGNRILELNFSENIAPGNNKNIYIHRTSDNQLFQTINTTNDAGLFTAVDTSLQITHNPLWGNTSFYVLADEGLAVSAANGLAAEGITNTTRWSFTTAGGPQVETISPAPISTGVSVSAPFEINFNENISTGTSGSVTIHLSGDSSVVEAINYNSPQLSVSNDTLTINHLGLTPETEYFITVDNGLAISTTTGTTWDGISDASWNFTTAGAPTISGYNPLSGETSAPVNQPLTLTFSENIKSGTSGYIKIRKEGNNYFQDIPFDAGLLSINNTELQISHSLLDPETTYFITMDNDVVRSASTDVSFQGINDTTQWRFTTAAPPAANTFSPINGSVLTSASENLVVSFSENIELGATGSFRIRYTNSGNARFQAIAVEDTDYINITDNIMTISHLEFTPDTGYFILIDEGFVKSTTSGVAFSGIQDTTTWTLTAPAGPAISAYEPANGSIDIPVDSALTLTFNENIARGTGNMVIHLQSNGSDVTSMNAGSSNLTIAGNKLTFNNLYLPHEETLYVTMDAGFVKSAATGFIFNGISDTTEWAFTTLPEPPAWTNGYPYFSMQSTSTISLDLQTSTNANYYFVITQGSAQPTTTEIMNGQKAGGGSALDSGTGTLVANTPITRENIDISLLTAGANYYMHVVAKNPDKELFSSIATIVIDKIAPSTTIIPANGTTHFPENGVIRISFNETIYNDLGNRVDSTNVDGLVALTLESNGTPVTSTVNIDISGTEITVTPAAALDATTGYTVTMQPVYDQPGNGQTAAVTSTFSTDKLNIWTGGGDVANWGDANNWSTGAFVDNTSIKVPSTATNYPEVTGNLNVFNVNLEPGTALSHSSGTLTVNGAFRLQSSTSANASYINSGGSLAVNNDSVNIEQHITGLQKTYYLSSPVTGATKNNTGLSDRLLRFVNSTSKWVDLNDTESWLPGEGYVGKSSQSLIFSGAITTGTQIINVERSTAGLGWNLVGNPYTASINWDALSGLTKSNIVDAFWIYLDDQGGYGAYNDNSGMSINISDPKIPSNHSFWVKVVEGEPTDTGSVTISPSALEINTNSYLKSAEKPEFRGFKLAALSDAGTDETGVLFIPDASIGNDKYDTDKMNATNPDLLQIFTTDSENTKLCINGLPENEDYEVTLGYIAGKPGSYTIKMQENYLPDHLELILTDHLTSVEHSISQGDYQFNVESKGTSNDRFSLKTVQAVATNVNEKLRSETPAECLVYTQNSQIVVETPNVQNLKYQLNDMSGRTLKNGKLNANSIHRIDTPKTGIYVLTILSDQGKEQHKVAVE
jgi:hypothetical protein